MGRLCDAIVMAGLVAATGLFVACNEEDEWDSMGKEGCPSRFVYHDRRLTGENQGAGLRTILWAYEGNRISKIRTSSGGLITFAYDGQNVESVSVSPPPGMADGNGWEQFRWEGTDKIRVESSGEPLLDVVRVQEIELDERRYPASITEMGYYQRRENGLSLLREGKTYTLFSFDPDTRQLLEQRTYDRTDSTLVSGYAYEYDASPGSLSGTEWPLWFFAYMAYPGELSSGLYELQFLNYVHNVVKVRVYTSETDAYEETNYSCTYNLNGYPVKVVSDREPENSIVISY